MPAVSSYTFKMAATSEEFAEIHRLNHQIFVDEVGQHEPTSTGRLIDQFHEKNIYFIAKRGDLLVGMISVHDQPPFSVASKLRDSSVLTALGSGLLEVRLLAIHSDERNSRVFAGLLYAVLIHACAGRYTHLIISGVEKHLRMYARFGFRAIGPAVSRGKTEFTPMALLISDIPLKTVNRFRKWATGSKPVCLLPGPVQVSLAVQLAFAGPPVSHRSPAFIAEFEEIRARLQQLSGGMQVGLFPGSGTLANDVVAAAIAADPACKSGLVLANGEFGNRLVRHATRWRLPHTALFSEWGTAWDMESIAACLNQHPDIDWIWAVQLETSTGMLNNTSALLELAQARGIRVYLDCVSGFGAIEPNLRGIAMATAVSGKSLGGYGGAAIVLIRKDTVERFKPEAFPPSLDLPAALKSKGPLMTFPSPVVKALRQALNEQGPDKWARYRALGEFVRENLRASGLETIVDGPDAAPVITTFKLRDGQSPAACMKRCAVAGFTIAGESDYLVKRNWLQIATMGDVRSEDLSLLFAALH